MYANCPAGWTSQATINSNHCCWNTKQPYVTQQWMRNKWRWHTRGVIEVRTRHISTSADKDLQCHTCTWLTSTCQYRRGNTNTTPNAWQALRPSYQPQTHCAAHYLVEDALPDHPKTNCPKGQSISGTNPQWIPCWTLHSWCCMGTPLVCCSVPKIQTRD